MKIEDQVIKLAVKKMTGEANPNELQELDDLFQKDAALCAHNFKLAPPSYFSTFNNKISGVLITVTE